MTPPPPLDQVRFGSSVAMRGDSCGCPKSCLSPAGDRHGNSCGGTESCLCQQVLCTVDPMEAKSHACCCWIEGGAAVTGGRSCGTSLSSGISSSGIRLSRYR
jgi:hypothetical protein